jgi:hypothetical protein
MRDLSFRLGLLALMSWTTVSMLGNDRVSLNSGSSVVWQVFPADGASASAVSAVGYTPSDGVPGIVPGTVFNAYVEAGREADPGYGDNIYNIDESKYNKPFWYRTEFKRPAASASRHTILTFEGTNRYATVYLNGRQLGRIKGYQLKARYDVTDLLQADNVLAVFIELPGAEWTGRDKSFANYAMPTYIAAHGWDWCPYVPGLLTGITNGVYLDVAGEVTIRDPWVRTKALGSGHTQAQLGLSASVVNLTGTEKVVRLRATVMPGAYQTFKDVTLAAGDSATFTLDDVGVSNPKLWWPNGCGDQNLYSALFEILADGMVIDRDSVAFGIKTYAYKKENTALTLYVNGRKVYCKGGNWGLSDYLMRCQGSDYDMRLRLHKDMNYNMVRLWTGCVTDEAFYEACDKYGIMVWDDFNLTGPYTGLTGPNDRTEFVSNARDKVVRLRNHPSLAVWCGDNEGWPYDELNADLKGLVSTFDGGDRVYLPNSHNGYASNAAYQAKDGTGLGLSGSGWWTNFPPKEYFATGIWGGGGDKGDGVDWGFRSELGMGAFTTFESFRQMMPEEHWWPRNSYWDKHFFSDDSAYGGGAQGTKYFNTVEGNYGTCSGIEEFCTKAQLTNIETMKAMYEGWQDNLWNTASGLLFWMSQPAWPCLIWQTYDYYYDATGTYWGAKKACEPVHIQWNCSNDKINVVNLSPTDLSGLTARTEVFRLDGTPYEPYTSTTTGVSAPSNAVTQVYRLQSAVKNLALGKRCVASNYAEDNLKPENAFDGNSTTRWSSKYFGYDDSWIYVDLGEQQTIGSIRLVWENADVYGKKYKLQVSDDATNWTDVYTEDNGNGGEDYIRLGTPVRGRYVKMQGVARSSMWGYSLYEFEVYGSADTGQTALDGSYFIRLTLSDASGTPLSRNFYWASTRTNNTYADYRDLAGLPKADVKCEIVSSGVQDGVHRLTVKLTNQSSTTAFALRLRLVDASGNRILPVFMDDNYITLFGGESQTIAMAYDADRANDAAKVLLKQYLYGEEETVTDGIRPIRSGGGHAAGAANAAGVYVLSGQKVRSGTSVSGLPKGIYIVKGKKIIIK